MKIIFLDIESTVVFINEEILNESDNSIKIKKTIDNSPYNPKNRIVSISYRKGYYNSPTDNFIGPDNTLIFHHNDYLDQYLDEFGNIKTRHKSDNIDQLIDDLANSDIIVGHNLKYDAMYLLEAGFTLPSILRDTMIIEFILARGVKKSLSLKNVANLRQVTQKKSELIDDYFKNGIGFEAIPLPIMLEYADADVLSMAEIFIQQLIELETIEEYHSLNNIVILMHEMLEFILEIERNGIAIDVEALNEVKQQYEIESRELNKSMNNIISSVMGDTPVNLNSGDDISKVVYSRQVVDKHKWKEIFNLGIDPRTRKPKHSIRASSQQFANYVRANTTKVYKTQASHCYTCSGKGWIQKIKKDGTQWKKTTVCNQCNGSGYLYLPTDKIAGFKLSPRGPADTSVHGFKLDKNNLDALIYQAKNKGNVEAELFLTNKKRLNAVNVYLNSFVKGIERWTRDDGLLHAGFNQTITATGRLSSSNP